MNERSARPGENIPEDSLAIVLTAGASAQAHQLSEPTMLVAGYVWRDAVPTEIASVIAALADICSRDPLGRRAADGQSAVCGLSLFPSVQPYEAVGVCPAARLGPVPDV